MPVVVNGVREFLKAIDEIDEDMYKNVRASLKTPMLKTANKAKQYLPANQNVLSGWLKQAPQQPGQRRPFPAYDQQTAQSEIKYKLGPNKKNKKGYSVYNYVSNESPAGAIYETAGRKNPQGRAPIMSTTLKELGNVQGYEGKKSGKKRSTRDYNSNNPFAGYQFVSALEPVTSQPKTKGVRSGGVKTKGRLIYKAFANQSPQIYQAILNAINATAVDFNKSYDKKAA